MFSLTVRRNFMIAHSLPRAAFGPAQGLHGATFVTEVTFRRRTLNEDAIVLDIGEAGDVLDAVLAGLNYKNLDEHPDFAGKLSTTEALAQYIADAVAAKIRGGRDGQRARRASTSPCARPPTPGPATRSTSTPASSPVEATGRAAVGARQRPAQLRRQRLQRRAAPRALAALGVAVGVLRGRRRLAGRQPRGPAAAGPAACRTRRRRAASRSWTACLPAGRRTNWKRPPRPGCRPGSCCTCRWPGIRNWNAAPCRPRPGSSASATGQRPRCGSCTGGRIGRAGRPGWAGQHRGRAPGTEPAPLASGSEPPHLLARGRAAAQQGPAAAAAGAVRAHGPAPGRRPSPVRTPQIPRYAALLRQETAASGPDGPSPAFRASCAAPRWTPNGPPPTSAC